MSQKVTATGLITVTKRPPGEAPDWVRMAWVGVDLPALPYMVYTDGKETGVLSGEKANLRTVGFIVPQKEAIEALAFIYPGAAKWWYENGFPHTEEGHDHFFFDTTVAEIVSGIDPNVKPIMVADDMEMGFFELPGR